MSHTPGPWEVSDTSIVTEDYCIAVIEDDGGYEVTGEQQIANAHLIAAAPDLLASLRKAIAVIEDLYKWEPIQTQHEETGVEWKGIRMDKPERYVEFSNQAGVPPEDMNPILDGLRAAIAKATTPATQERQKGEG